MRGARAPRSGFQCPCAKGNPTTEESGREVHYLAFAMESRQESRERKCKDRTEKPR